MMKSSITEALAAQIERQLREKISSIVDPATGERPVVMFVGEFPNWKVEIQGSDELLSIVSERLKEEYTADAEALTSNQGTELSTTPYVFLSHAYSDRVLAKELADKLSGCGISCFIDTDDIRGDSGFVEKIDSAFSKCTHFVALLTHASVQRHWVRHEMRIAAARVVEGRLPFFALGANGYSVREFQSDFATLSHVPLQTFSAVNEFVHGLAGDILGVSRRPVLGEQPAIAAKPRGHGLSQAAYGIVECFVNESKRAMDFDPSSSVGDLRATLGLTLEQVDDAIHELKGLDCIREHESTGSWTISARAELFSRFDNLFLDHDPEVDARRIASRAMSESMRAADMAAEFGWNARRFNPGLQWLLSRDLLRQRDLCIGDHDFLQLDIISNANTRRFAKASGK